MNRIDGNGDGAPSTKKFKSHHVTSDDDDTPLLRNRSAPSSPMPKVTVDVVIPVHNSGKTIVECLESVCTQTYDLNLITVCIFDDSSTDSSKEIISSFIESKSTTTDLKFRFGFHKGGSRGAGFARNEAVKLSDSLMIALLDSDDVMMPDRILCQVQSIYATDSVDSTICGCKFFRLPENSTAHYSEWANSLTDRRLYLEQFRELTVLQPTWLFSRSLFTELGGYNNKLSLADEEPSELRLAEDFRFFHAHLENNGKLMVVGGGAGGDEPLLMYRHSDDNSNLSSKTPRKLIMRLRLKSFEERILRESGGNWSDGFVVWGAGRDGKEFIKSLSPDLLPRVKFIVDVDEKKIAAGYHHRNRNIHIDIKNFRVLQEEEFKGLPVVVCVAMYRTGGKLEENVRSVGRTEGVDLWHFN